MIHYIFNKLINYYNIDSHLYKKKPVARQKKKRAQSQTETSQFARADSPVSTCPHLFIHPRRSGACHCAKRTHICIYIHIDVRACISELLFPLIVITAGSEKDN